MKHCCSLLAPLAVCLALIACSVGTTVPPAPTAAVPPTTPAPAPANTATALPSPTLLPNVPTLPPATATPGQMVASADGLAQLVVPSGALPAGVSLADLHIVA